MRHLWSKKGASVQQFCTLWLAPVIVKAALGALCGFLMVGCLKAASPASASATIELKSQPNIPYLKMPGNANQGGQDGGGGTVDQSSPQQVRAALRRAFELAYEPELNLNVYHSFLSWQILRTGFDQNVRKVPAVQIQKSFTALEAAMEILMGPEVSKNKATLKTVRTRFTNLLKQSKLNVRKQGACAVSGSPHADASVSEFRPGAELCFSIQNLTRIPPNVLEREILSLLLHEAAHLCGFDEPKAQAVQAAFSEYYAFRFGAMSGVSVMMKTNYGLEQARSLMREAETLVAEKNEGPRLYAVMGRFSEVLLRLPSWDDVLALRLMFAGSNENSNENSNEKRLKAVSAYSNSVLALVQDVRKSLGMQVCDLCGRERPVRPEKISVVMERIAKSFETVELNWTVATTGEGDFECVDFPELDRDTDLDQIYTMNSKGAFNLLGRDFLFKPSCR